MYRKVLKSKEGRSCNGEDGSMRSEAKSDVESEVTNDKTDNK